MLFLYTTKLLVASPYVHHIDMIIAQLQRTSCIVANVSSWNVSTARQNYTGRSFLSEKRLCPRLSQRQLPQEVIRCFCSRLLNTLLCIVCDKFTGVTSVDSLHPNPTCVSLCITLQFVM